MATPPRGELDANIGGNVSGVNGSIDNLDILRRYLKDESVDLVYLDPPFNSAQDYNAFFHEKDGTAAASQIKAFEDTWHWDTGAARVYQAVTEQPGKVSDVMQAFFIFLGGNDMISASTPDQRDAIQDDKTIIVRVVGEPATPADASRLAEEDKFQFQWWALGLVGARPEEEKKGADRGIDGKILFRDDPRTTKPERIIIQVKGGKTGAKDVRDLRGVLEREQAAIGVLISLQSPTGPMESEAASAGFYTHKLNGQQYPRLQLRTIRELMEGKGIERPSTAAATDDTFKKAPKAKTKGHEQQGLDFMAHT